MPDRERVRVMEFGTIEAEEIRKALLSEQRMRLLAILSKGDLTVGEIADALNISQPNASVHVRVLEQAGLITTRLIPANKGAAKVCSLAVDNLIFQRAFRAKTPSECFTEVAVPVGLFTSIQANGDCGWTTADGAMLTRESKGVFHPERARAQILWMSDAGWVEYGLPAELPSSAELIAVDFEVEVCSERPPKRGEAPSDITVWINGLEIGTWTSPADFIAKRGILNPDWWSTRWTQHGILKTWTVARDGSYIDHERCSDVRVSNLGISPERVTMLRIGVKDDAANKGGLNIFGQHFGNHPQDPILRYRFRPSHPAQQSANPQA